MSVFVIWFVIYFLCIELLQPQIIAQWKHGHFYRLLQRTSVFLYSCKGESGLLVIVALLSNNLKSDYG